MITTKAKNFHLRIDLRGALMNWSDHEWRNCVTGKDGKTLTPVEVKRGFLDELANGNDYIPLGDCDNFDPKHGCMGHPVHDEHTGGEA